MKKIVVPVLVIMLLLSLAVMTGCGSGGGSQGSSSQGSSSQSPAHLTFATAGTGGTFYPLGGGMAKIISANVPNTQVTAEATGGSVENARLLDKGEAELAFVAGDVAYQAYNGEGDFKEKLKLVALFSTYSEPVHIVTLADKNINSVMDLKGKKVAVGSPGSGTEVKARAMLNALGITYDDIDEQFLSFAEAADAMKDNNIDAAVMAVGAPASAVMDLSAVRSVKLISLTKDEINKVKAKYPYFTESKIEKGAYEKIPVEVETVAVPIIIAAKTDISEQTAYGVTKAIFEHLPELHAVHKVAEEIKLETAGPAIIPLHPGAAKYFKEKGLTW